MSNYATIDLETSVKNVGENAIGKNKASPFCKDNHICYLGSKRGNEITTVGNPAHITVPPDVKLLVGANFKFDLLYMMRDSGDIREWLKTGKVWCIQLAEYLLTGQESKWGKLDDMAVKYGGHVKDDRLKEMWNNGVDTEDIDEDIIIPYLEGDVTNTELVFKQQVAKAQEMDILALIWTQMDALLATTEMEHNGMAFDKQSCVEDSIAIREEVSEIEERLNGVIAGYLNIDIKDAKCGSPKQVSTLLFGGEVMRKVAVPVMEDGAEARYKTGKRKGQVKTILKQVFEEVSGFNLTPDPTWVTKKAGTYQVNDKVLEELLVQHSGTVASNTFIKELQTFRKLNKDLRTYYQGYSELVWSDGRIHPQFNHCATATGRLSHSAPNLGNVSHSKED